MRPVASVLFAAAAAACALVTIPRDARADDDPPSAATASPQPRLTKEHWYGGQTLAADGAALALVVAGIGLQSGGLTLFGATAYLGGGPIVHWAHGHVGMGFADLGIRAGLPFAGLFVGAMAGAVIFRNDGVYGSLLAGAVGFLGGIVGASVIDSAALAYEDVPVRPVTSLHIAPTVGVEREPRGGGSRTTLGLAGTF
jgi:hypothetical protein